MTAPTTSRRERIAANPSSGRIAATGGIFAARREGTMTDSIVTPMPTIAATTTVRGRSTGVEDGKPAPIALKPKTISWATPSPAIIPRHGAGDADAERLDRDHAADLLARRADRSQERELAQPLADRDLEHVVDDERRDERRDEGEDQQPGPEDRDELTDLILELLDQHLAVDDLVLVAERGDDRPPRP